MGAGKYKHRGTFKRPIIAKNNHGENEITGYTTIHSRVPVCVIQTGSRELWNAQQMQPDVSCIVELRKLSGITSAMVMEWDDGKQVRTLNIAGPPISKGQETILTCIEPK